MTIRHATRHPVLLRPRRERRRIAASTKCPRVASTTGGVAPESHAPMRRAPYSRVLSIADLSGASYPRRPIVATDWQSATAADGPALAAYFEDILAYGGHPEVAFGEFFARCMRQWRGGHHPGVFTVDRCAVALGLHLSEVPDHVWLWSGCTVCGGALPDGSRRNRRYCSQKCYQRAYRIRALDRAERTVAVAA